MNKVILCPQEEEHGGRYSHVYPFSSDMFPGCIGGTFSPLNHAAKKLVDIFYHVSASYKYHEEFGEYDYT